MRELKARYKFYFSNREFIIITLEAFSILILSIIANFYTALYASERASNYVTDIILSNISVYDVDGIFVYGPLIMWTLVIFLCLHKPSRIPFTLKSIALFVLIRSVFTSLTHISPFPDQIIINPESFINYFSSGADLFFSGHTGLPFLLSLIFWDNIYLRILFFATSIMFGIVVLLGHLHYSIDVLSAFFITYAIFHIALKLFKKDREIFFSELEK